MSRKPDPKIKQHLLDQCLEGALERGSLNIGIHEYAEIAHTSARMLIYHFGSKARLDEEIAIRLDETMRQEFKRLLDGSTGADALLDFWLHITRNTKLKKLAVLSLTQTADMQGNHRFRKEMEKQTLHWLEVIRKYFDSDLAAETAFLVAQGAMIDYFVTGNKERGRRCIERVLKLK
jgi:AcrR family transcriptional regulator